MPSATMPLPTTHDSDPPQGGRLVAADGRELILRSVALRVDAAGGIARAVLEQRFENPYAEPLALTYQLPLPADGAVAGFAFRIGETRVAGTIARRAEARERFEQAMLEGRTASILDQERSSLFTQEIGNVPPSTAVIAEITIDQRLRWDDAGWEWRFPTTVAPRYHGGSGRVPDAERVSVDVLDAAVPATLDLALAIGDAIVHGTAPTSPSHALACTRDAGGAHRIRLADAARAALDRDLVVRWRVASDAIATRLEVARPAGGHARADLAFGLLTILPPATSTPALRIPRDLIVLIDASGSMAERPLEQARQAVRHLVASLDERDSLELVAFASSPVAFRRHAERATPSLRADALDWLAKLEAGGATEMDRAIQGALRPLRSGALRQVVLVSDGLVGFEEEIVARVLRELPRSARLHTIGVGSAPNRTLTQAAARAGRGVEILLGLDEDPRDAAQRLLENLAAPLVAELSVTGSAVRAVAPARIRDVAAGSPVLVALALDPAGGDLAIRADGFEQRIRVAPVEPGAGNEALAALFAREAVEDLESRAASGEAVDAEIEAIGLAYSIATRRTSWIAVSEEPTIDPTAPTRRRQIPHALPYGLSAEALGLRAALGAYVCFEAVPQCADVVSAQEGIDEPKFRGRRRMAPLADGSSLFNRRLGIRPSLERSLDAAGPSDHGLVYVGRLVRLTERELVVEFEVGPDALHWDPRDVRVRIEENILLIGSASIDRSASTAPGTIAAGCVVRVVLRLDAPLPSAPAALVIESAHDEIVVQLGG